MARKDELRDIHKLCLNAERDEDGDLTGAVCRKSWAHTDKTKNPDPRRRAHFDPDRERIWGPDVEAMIRS